MKRQILLVVLVLVVSVLSIGFYGCAGVGQSSSELGEKTFRPWHITPVESDSLNLPYYITILGTTNSADVYDLFSVREDELLSQSHSVLACFGEDVKRKKAWYNMIVFDEDNLTATRKYFLNTYDKPKEWFMLKEKLRFDVKLQLLPSVIDEPFASENARRIFVLEEIQKNFNADVTQVKNDNRNIGNISLLANQTLNVIITYLKETPAYASRLNRVKGLDFDHPTLNGGKVRMIIDDEKDTVSLKIKIGTVIKTWNDQRDVIEMEKF